MANYFVDREVEHPGRVNLAPVDSNLMTASIDSNGVASFSNSEDGLVADLTRAEGTVSTEGTPLNATSLNGGINEMIAAALEGLIRPVVVQANSLKELANAAGREYIVVWTGQGNTGSRGIDYVWSDGTVTSRSVSLTGTALLQYGGNDEILVLQNTASATVIHAMVIGTDTVS